MAYLSNFFASKANFVKMATVLALLLVVQLLFPFSLFAQEQPPVESDSESVVQDVGDVGDAPTDESPADEAPADEAPAVDEPQDESQTEELATPTDTWEKVNDQTYVIAGGVELNKTYVAPQNSEVTVTFTTLPEAAGSLSVEEITLSDAEQAQLKAASKTAYDITSNMENGTFAYDLTLPIPEYIEDTSKVTVQYAESVAELMDNATSVQHPVFEDNSVTVNGLDHFTYFVIVLDGLGPIDEVCEDGPTWAAGVVGSNQGTRKDSSPVDASRSDPNNALGSSDSSFFSLGVNGDLTLKFAGFVIDVPGNDLSFHEVTNGRDTYPEELASVDVSQDGSTWFPVGNSSSQDPSGITLLDFSGTGLSWVQYVRLTDITDFGPHNSEADGYDVESVDGVQQYCTTVTLEKTGEYDSTTGIISYTIYWAVIGTGSIDDLVISDYIPAGTTYVPASASPPGVYDSLLIKLTWALGAQAAGSSGSVTFDVTVDASLAIDQWASTVVGFTQGLKADLLTPVDANRSDASETLGVAESSGSVYDNPLAAYIGKFFSLGFFQDGTGGSLTVSFAQPVFNGPGDDLTVFEITAGDNYPDEEITVDVSDDNATWSNVGVVVRDGSVDLGLAPSANYIRVTGISDITEYQPDADNYDVDGLKALHLIPEVCSIENIAKSYWSDGQEQSQYVFSTTASTKTIINREFCDGGDDNNDFKIAGMVYNDHDNEGDKDPGDEGLAGWTVYLDNNDNNSKDEGEPTETSDGSGNYEFTNLAAGCYTVREEPLSGWDITDPIDAEENEYEVSVGFAICGELTDAVNDDQGFFASLFKTAFAATGVTGTPNAIGVDFGNFTQDQGGCNGDCSNGSSSSSGSSSNNDNPPGLVLGDTTTTPSQPQVLGTTDTLPRTGMSVLPILLLVFLAASAVTYRTLATKQS